LKRRHHTNYRPGTGVLSVIAESRDLTPRIIVVYSPA
jgi:hypothetical protein